MFKSSKDYYIRFNNLHIFSNSGGAFIRLYLPLEATFPLYDGGFFYSFLPEGKFAF